MSSRYPVTLLSRDTCGTDVLTFRFSRPAGYEFRAGQWFRLSLATPEGDLAETFSHCGAPGDPDIEMATRLSSSPFKQALATLQPGDAATVSASGGRLSIPTDTTRVCFLIGGVGITPVRSMLRDAQQTGRRFDDALLLYGNRDETCMPFASEFEAMQAIGVRVVHVLERPSDAWRGERGFITAETVRRHIEVSEGLVFVAAGPPVMVAAMERVLDTLGIDDAYRIVEHFGVVPRT